MITSFDFQRISQLLINTSMSGKIGALERKLYFSEVVASEIITHDFVTMNSEVRIHDLTLNERLSLRLVFQLSPLYRNQVSVLAPLGTALLGMKLNETASYELRDGGTRDILIEEILYQPEANGDFEL